MSEFDIAYGKLIKRGQNKCASVGQYTVSAGAFSVFIKRTLRCQQANGPVDHKGIGEG